MIRLASQASNAYGDALSLRRYAVTWRTTHPKGPEGPKGPKIEALMESWRGYTL